MIKDKIKMLLIATNKTQRGLAERHNVVEQQMSNKIRSGAFKAKDLIDLADFTGTTLAFVDSTGKPVVTFDMKDIGN